MSRKRPLLLARPALASGVILLASIGGQPYAEAARQHRPSKYKGREPATSPSSSPVVPDPLASVQPPALAIEHSHLVETLYDTPPSDPAVIRDALEVCDSDLGCAGISIESRYDEREDDDVTYMYRHTFLDGKNYTEGKLGVDLTCDPNDYRDGGNCQAIADAKLLGDKTHLTAITSKPYAFHRGRIVAGSIITAKKRLTIAEAKDYCTSAISPGCIAFTFPVWSKYDLNTVPNVTFFSSVDAFERSKVRGGIDEWRSYVSTDPARSQFVKSDILDDIDMELGKRNINDWTQAERARLFGTCCNDETIRGGYPSIAAVAKADTMPRIACNLTRQEFYEQYEVPRKPVMLTGCADKWPAMTEWTYDKLANRFSNYSLWRARIGDGPENYQNGIEWRDIAHHMRNDLRFYVFDQLEDYEAKTLEDDYEWPGPIKDADLYAEMKARGHFFAGPLRWFALGKLGSGTQPHNDPYASDAWNTLIKGHKWWIIWPEGVKEDEHLDYIRCDETCSNREPFVREWASAIGINAAKTEYFPGQYAEHVLQSPGETIYVPDGRLHTVFNLDSTIAITANYGTAANLDSVWEAACNDGVTDIKARIMYNLVLNAEQRAHVRQTRFWPMEVACTKPGYQTSKVAKKQLEDFPYQHLSNAFYDKDWYPKAGDIAEVRYKGDRNEYYKGTITRASKGTYDILYVDGDRDYKLPRRALARFRLYNTGELVDVYDEKRDQWQLAIVRQPVPGSDRLIEVMRYGQNQIDIVQSDKFRRFDWQFRPGNRVLAKFLDDETQWYPGTVIEDRGNGRFSIRFDDGDVATAHRDEMMLKWATKAFEEDPEELT